MDTVLHIGAHKTATTYLQQILRQNRELCRSHDVAMILPGQMRSGKLNVDGKLMWEPEFLPDLSAQVAAHTGDATRLLISEENIMLATIGIVARSTAKFYPHAARRVDALRQIYGLGEVDILLAIRNPTDFLVSAFSQYLMEGFFTDFETFVGKRDPLRVTWSEMVTRLHRVSGLGRITVWRYEDLQRVRGDVLAAMLGDALAAKLICTEDVQHAGVSARAMEALMERMTQAGEPSKISRETIAEMVRELRKSFPKTADSPSFDPWGAELRARVSDAYAEDCARIAAMPGVRFLGFEDAAG